MLRVTEYSGRRDPGLEIRLDVAHTKTALSDIALYATSSYFYNQRTDSENTIRIKINNGGFLPNLQPFHQIKTKLLGFTKFFCLFFNFALAYSIQS